MILGAAGMLGHKLVQQLQTDCEVWGTVQSPAVALRHLQLLPQSHLIGGVDAGSFDSVMRAVAVVRPDCVINCIGIVKQLKSAVDPLESIAVNAIFPHRLAELCAVGHIRLIHISTDCVFSGRKGAYKEEDISDAEDLYGRTKFLGEVSQEGCLTLRTSIIGRELSGTTGLVEWFLSNRGLSVRGFRHAVFSGFTTIGLARIINRLIWNNPDLSGVYQVSADPINKFELLTLIGRRFEVDIEVIPVDEPHIDRSLDSTRFRKALGYSPPSWEAMIHEMADDPTPYDHWRQHSSP